MERDKHIDSPTSIDVLSKGFLTAPEVITSPYPFIVIGDLDEIVSHLTPNKKDNLVSESFQSELLELHKKYAPKVSTFYYIDQKTLLTKTEVLIDSKYKKEVEMGSNVGIINFDKYLLSRSDYGNLLRINLSRGPSGTLVSRPGSKMDKNSQLEMMDNWLLLGDYNSLILTDDVVAFADTFSQTVNRIKGVLPGVKISVVSGVCSSQGEWRGKEKLEDLDVGVTSVILSNASASIEGGSSGMAIPDSRDFTIFGGKVENISSGRVLSFPYFFPFSKPLNSFYENGSEYSGSLDIFKFNQRLVGEIEGLRCDDLTIGDLEKVGFGVPYSSIDEVRRKIAVPDSSVLVRDYLDQMKQLF